MLKSEREKEIKFEMSREDRKHIFKKYAAACDGGKIKEKETVRHYWETRDLDVYNAGLSLRTQIKTDKNGDPYWELTVKYAAADQDPNALVSDRIESKYRQNGFQLDLSVITDERALELLAPFHDKEFENAFDIQARRKYFERTKQLKDSEIVGTTEFSFDKGVYILKDKGLVVYTGPDCRMREQELEYKAGDEKVLEHYCKKIQKQAPSAKVLRGNTKLRRGVELWEEHVLSKNGKNVSLNALTPN